MIEQLPDIKLKNVTGMSPLELQQTLSSIDAPGVLQSLGLSEEESARALAGDTSAISDRIFNKLMILDFDTTMKNHGATLSTEVCLTFFRHAREHVDFNDEEVNAFRPIYLKFFAMCFTVGSDFVYSFPTSSEFKNIIIRVQGEYYQLSMNKEDRLILHLPNFDPDSL
jgi:hypothetical protein